MDKSHLMRSYNRYKWNCWPEKDSNYGAGRTGSALDYGIAVLDAKTRHRKIIENSRKIHQMSLYTFIKTQCVKHGTELKVLDKN